MLELKKGIDILAGVGGISTLDEAEALFEIKCDEENLAKLSKIINEEALLKIANAISMTDPDAVFVNTGSDADVQKVREMSLEKGEEQPLAMKDHTIHFDLAQEQARIIDRTFYIVNEGEAEDPSALRLRFRLWKSRRQRTSCTRQTSCTGMSMTDLMKKRNEWGCS